jgi:uncharacterized protein YfaS (alpha-2-macroglobulin family)
MPSVAGLPISYDRGDLVRVSVNFQVDGVATDPTAVTLKVRKPDGTVDTFTFVGGDVVKDSTGNYHHDINTTAGPAGVWSYRFEGIGAAQGAEEAEFIVKAGAF